MGLDQPGVNHLIKSTYKLLNLQTYFTAGEKEVRAWTIVKGTKAPKAAAVIHTDFEKDSLGQKLFLMKILSSTVLNLIVEIMENFL